MPAPRLLLISDHLWHQTVQTLAPYAHAGVEAGLYWYGLRNTDAQAAVVAAIGIPRQLNRTRNFEVRDDDLATLTRRVPEPLVAVGALHTHPGANTHHSDWDDERVISRKILSLVLPFYGRDPNLANAGVHEHVDGRWTSLAPGDTQERVIVNPSVVDTRS